MKRPDRKLVMLGAFFMVLGAVIAVYNMIFYRENVFYDFLGLLVTLPIFYLIAWFLKEKEKN